MTTLTDKMRALQAQLASASFLTASEASDILGRIRNELPALVIALAASHELLCRRATDPIEDHHRLAEEVAALLRRIEERMKP